MLRQGRPLSWQEQSLFSPYFSEHTLAAARIIDGHTPFWLRQQMCAVVLGTKIYFRAGVYQPNHIASVELLAHELTHVEQYLSGMTLLKYCWAARHGYIKNPYEIEAYEKASVVRETILKNQPLLAKKWNSLKFVNLP